MRPARHPKRWRAASTGAMLAGAALLVWSAAIHLHLWTVGYRHIPTIGPLFLFQGIGGVVLAAVVAGTRRVLPALAAMAFFGSSIGGLLISAWVGLFGFRDGLDAPFAQMSLVVEAVGIAVLAAAIALRFEGGGAARQVADLVSLGAGEHRSMDK